MKLNLEHVIRLSYLKFKDFKRTTTPSLLQEVIEQLYKWKEILFELNELAYIMILGFPMLSTLVTMSCLIVDNTRSSLVTFHDLLFQTVEVHPFGPMCATEAPAVSLQRCRSLVQCGVFCSSDENCKGFNWKDNLRTCELFWNISKQYQSIQGCVLFQVSKKLSTPVTIWYCNYCLISSVFFKTSVHFLPKRLVWYVRNQFRIFVRIVFVMKFPNGSGSSHSSSNFLRSIRPGCMQHVRIYYKTQQQAWIQNFRRANISW